MVNASGLTRKPSLWDRLRRKGRSVSSTSGRSPLSDSTTSTSASIKPSDPEPAGPLVESPAEDGHALSRVATSSDKCESEKRDQPEQCLQAPPSSQASLLSTPSRRLSRRGSVISIAQSIRSLAQRPSMSRQSSSVSSAKRKERPVLSISTQTATKRTDSTSTMSRSGSGSDRSGSVDSVSTAPTSPECSTSALPPPQSPFKPRPPPTFSPINGPCPDVYIIPAFSVPTTPKPLHHLRSLPASPSQRQHRMSTADLVFGPHHFDHHKALPGAPGSVRHHHRARSLDGHAEARWRAHTLPPPPEIPSQWSAEPRTRPHSYMPPAPQSMCHAPTSLSRPASIRHSRVAYVTPKSSFEVTSYESSRRSSEHGHAMPSSRRGSLLAVDLSEDPPQRLVLRVVNPD